MKPGDLFRTQGIKTLYKSKESNIGDPIDEIPWNTIGIILQVHNYWLRIITPTGITGWCSNTHIKVVQ
jgi:hypothetical protein